MKDEKRKPTLADRFCAARYTTGNLPSFHPKVVEPLQAKVRQANRFLFDEEATIRVGRVVREIPTLLVRESAFARAPYDLTWLEFPQWRYWQEITSDIPDGMKDAQDENSDHTVGYLVDHNRVYVITGGTLGQPMHIPVPSAFYYELNTEWELQEQLDFAERHRVSRMQLDQYLWGSTVRRIGDADVRVLRAHNRVAAMPVRQAVLDSVDLQQLLLHSAGELRNIVAFLLMLNRPTVTHYIDKPASRGWASNKVIPYLSHRTVTVDLDAIVTMRLLGTPEGDAIARRRHEVKGHFCHNRRAREGNCIHVWHEAYDDWSPAGNAYLGHEALHWVCGICEGRRWRRQPHERGTAEKGFVVKDAYEVTA